MQNKKVVHIGMHKAASTFLQQNVFPSIGDKYFGKSYVVESAPIEELPEGIHSYENLSGHFLTGEKWEDNMYRLKQQKAEKIILILREPYSYSESAFKQYIAQGGIYHFKKLVSMGFFKPEKFKYYEIIKDYVALFGKENVMVIDYNDFKNDNNLYVKMISEFTGYNLKILNKTSTNIGLSYYSSKILWKLNRFGFTFKFMSRHKHRKMLKFLDRLGLNKIKRKWTDWGEFKNKLDIIIKKNNEYLDK